MKNDSEHLSNSSEHYCFHEFLSETDRNNFFNLHYTKQIELFESYLDHLEKSPVTFTNSAKKSTSDAHLQNDIEIAPDAPIQCLLDGTAVSGFGAQGTSTDYLPQRQLSMKVARFAGEIGHNFVVETKKGAPLVLNSRSFYSYWCHAEKQKFMDIQEKLHKMSGNKHPQEYWDQIYIKVDRIMCDDCIAFFQNTCQYLSLTIHIADPQQFRIFQSDGTIIQKLVDNNSL